MPAECTPQLFEFEEVERRAVVANFAGGEITSNAGALLLGQVDKGLALVRRFAACFRDPARSTLCRARGGDAGRAAHLRPGAGLRGPQRPRRAAQGSDLRG